MPYPSSAALVPASKSMSLKEAQRQILLQGQEVAEGGNWGGGQPDQPNISFMTCVCDNAKPIRILVLQDLQTKLPGELSKPVETALERAAPAAPTAAGEAPPGCTMRTTEEGNKPTSP